ncbi:unnamed protein product [Rhizoctonia solani]|uniref:Uncharacterized protein n=1 Tax=Rhizoctonia solani TaxID=456999 RepID=A0A8H2ZUP7_9AGAM|nr:unnamed protein product [Rhizoctonia solani]
MVNEILEDLRHSDSSNLLTKRPLSSTELSGRGSSPEITAGRWDWFLRVWPSRASSPTVEDPMATDQSAPAIDADTVSHPAQNDEIADILHNTNRYLAIGIFSLLSPESLSAADFLFDSLGSKLDKHAYIKLNKELARCLWYSRLDRALSDAIE